MFDQIKNIFWFSKNALNLIAYKQKILSSNIANIDTPNYQKLDFNFKDQLNYIIHQKYNNQLNLFNTAEKHICPIKKHISIDVNLKKDQRFNKKNNVDINQERMNFIRNSLKYQTQITLLNNEIKNIMNVIQG